MTSPQVCTPEPIRPCRYQIRERLFTFGNTFKITDDRGRDKYTVRSKMWTVGKKLVLEDMNGRYVK
jgi:uncharacterized protein YxjI